MKVTHFLLTRRLYPGIVALLLLTTLFLPAIAAAEQPPGGAGHRVFLPLVLKSGDAVATGPYRDILQKMQHMCAATGLNQVCVVSGQVDVQAAAGVQVASQPGTVTDLSGVQRLNLASTGTDPQQWAIAWLRLRADSGTPDQALNVLAFGNVQISDITLFDGQAAVTDTLTLPGLHFASSPVAGVTGEGSSGLLVINPTAEDLLSLRLNGAEITLGSTALMQAQPGQQMTVTMATGTSLTQSGSGGSSAIQNQQVSVPLNQSGQAAGAPNPPKTIDPLKYVFFDAFKPKPTQELGNSVLARLNRAIDRCLDHEARYVYNVLFWTHIIETDPALKAHIDPVKLTEAYDRAPDCLTFEVHFWSNVTTTSAYHSQASTIFDKPETIKVQFYADGGFLSSDTNDQLDYDSYQYTAAVSQCTILTQTTPGRLLPSDGWMKIAVNKVRVSLDLQLWEQPTDHAWLNCPPAPPVFLAQNHWVTAFYHLYKTYRPGSDLHSFRFGWDMAAKYGFGLGRYNTRRADAEFIYAGDTSVGLIHVPNGMN